MTSMAVATRIDELGQISRMRALTDFESGQLAKLIVAQNRYAYSKAQQDRKRAMQAVAL